MNKMEKYYSELQRIQCMVVEKETAKLRIVAKRMAETLRDGKMIYAFGCGHSHMLVEESFYRAGGLVRINPIFDNAIMLHDGALKSSVMERDEKYGGLIFDRQLIQPGDMLFVYSTSGVNGCPIEMARRGQQAGVIVVVVSSGNYGSEASRHSSGKYLVDFADYTIDNCVPYGDAIVENGDEKIGPCSTAISAMIWNMLICQTAEEGDALGYRPEYFMSGNVTGGKEKNENIITKYRRSIREF